jgi:two-component system KDP operon response regulator KdpE
MPAEACILVIEDDPSLRRSLAATLKAAGYRAVEAGAIAEAERAYAHHRPDLILLDLGLPDGDGVDFIARVRKAALTPVVVLSARGAETMKVAALDAGADDYITKPFGVDELLARLRAAFRHGVQAKGSAPIVRTGALEVDLSARIVRRSGAEVDLSPKEFAILALLAEHVGKVVRHRDLLKAVWGSERADIQYLRVYIGQLRAKLEIDPSQPAHILSDPGVGYRLARHEAAANT